jgi:hypothetical protein
VYPLDFVGHYEVRRFFLCFVIADVSFRLAVLGHAGPIRLELDVAPGMFDVLPGPETTLANGRRPRGADLSPALLRDALRCKGGNDKSQGNVDPDHSWSPYLLRISLLIAFETASSASLSIPRNETPGFHIFRRGIGPEEFISIADRYMATEKFRRRIGRDRRGAVCILAGRPPHDGV